MKQDKKFWGKNDEMLIGDTKADFKDLPIDPLKQEYHKI